MEETNKADSVGRVYGLIFLAWTISLIELSFSLTTFLGGGLSASAPHFPASVLVLLAAGPLAVFGIAFVVLFYGGFTVGRFLSMVIPGLVSLAEFIWLLLLWYAGGFYHAA